MSIPSFLRLVVVALTLYEGGVHAQPLVETYKRQEENRIRVEKICQSQFEKAQYQPVEGQEEDLRYMISAKGVQAIKAAVVPSKSGGSYMCDRGSYEQPMLLGRTYRSRAGYEHLPLEVLVQCPKFLSRSRTHFSECAALYKERLELEPCDIVLAGKVTIETSCLTRYTQYGDSHVKKSTLGFRSATQSK